MNAPASEKQYDVAISFTVEDIALAQALYDKLSEGFRVFFSPRRQEEIAGTDGMEIFRQTFLNQALINVVVYRDKWGNTPWTAVEAAAIKDSCVQNQFKNIFFLVVEKTSVFPDWLPYTHMRFHLGEYTVDQAVGAIKLRVGERGGHYKPLTPSRKAEFINAEQEYQWARDGIRSHEGIRSVLNEVTTLLQEIHRYCAEISAQGHLEIECEVNGKQACILRHDRVGMIVIWQQMYGNSLDNSGLSVDEYNGRLCFNSDQGVHIHIPQKPIKSTRYEPDLSRSREYGWRLAGKSTDIIPSQALAEKCLLQFMDLIERARDGKFR